VKVTLAGDRATDGLIGSHFLAAINNYLQNLNHYEDEIKRPFSIVKKMPQKQNHLS
jgi:hypothetical protein